MLRQMCFSPNTHSPYVISLHCIDLTECHLALPLEFDSKHLSTLSLQLNSRIREAAILHSCI